MSQCQECGIGYLKHGTCGNCGHRADSTQEDKAKAARQWLNKSCHYRTGSYECGLQPTVRIEGQPFLCPFHLEIERTYPQGAGTQEQWRIFQEWYAHLCIRERGGLGEITEVWRLVSGLPLPEGETPIYTAIIEKAEQKIVPGWRSLEEEKTFDRLQYADKQAIRKQAKELGQPLQEYFDNVKEQYHPRKISRVAT